MITQFAIEYTGVATSIVSLGIVALLVCAAMAWVWTRPGPENPTTGQPEGKNDRPSVELWKPEPGEWVEAKRFIRRREETVASPGDILRIDYIGFGWWKVESLFEPRRFFTVEEGDIQPLQCCYQIASHVRCPNNATHVTTMAGKDGWIHEAQPMVWCDSHPLPRGGRRPLYKCQSE